MKHDSPKKVAKRQIFFDSVNQKQLHKTELCRKESQKEIPLFWAPLQTFCANKIQNTQCKKLVFCRLFILARYMAC